MEQVFSDTASFVQVVLIDLALSADNAVAVGLAAAALPMAQRGRAVRWGIGLALVLRIAFGLVTVQLLRIRGLLAAGGALLLWISARMWRDLTQAPAAAGEADAAAARPAGVKPVSFTHALISIVIANIALSLDNVLAVAGVSRHAPWIMALGLVLSVLLMGVAASLIARLVERNPWIGFIGVAVIIVAGLVMMWDDAHWAGLHGILPFSVPAPPSWLGGA